MADNPFNIEFKPTANPVAETQTNLNNLQEGFSGAIKGQTGVPKLIESYDQKYGVPQIQQQIQQGTAQFDMLGNQIRGMDKTVAQGSQESLMTQGQRDRVVQSRQAPLMEQQNMLGQNLSRMGQNLATAQTNAGRMVEAEQVQQQKELSPWLRAFDNESIVSAMKMSGWQFENQTELSRLLANQQAGLQLSLAEQQRMHQLALQENEFANALKMQKEDQQWQMGQPGSNLISIGEGTSLFNPSTGKVEYKAPKTYQSSDDGSTFDLNSAIAQLKAPNMSTNNGPINSLWGF